MMDESTKFEHLTAHGEEPPCVIPSAEKPSPSNCHHKLNVHGSQETLPHDLAVAPLGQRCGVKYVLVARTTSEYRYIMVTYLHIKIHEMLISPVFCVFFLWQTIVTGSMHAHYGSCIRVRQPITSHAFRQEKRRCDLGSCAHQWPATTIGYRTRR